MSAAISERRVVFVVGAVQFVNILDFMIVMPMGPDFARALGIPISRLGYVGGAYAASASVAGLAGAFFLDRFDRRTALGVALLGLFLGTALGGLAVGFGSLVAARLVAGAFGGPATSIANAIIADVIPPARRGKAMGAVMGAFSAASVLGVPAGLELARRGGFRAAFFAVAALGILVWLFAIASLPSLTAHFEHRASAHEIGFARLLSRPTVPLSYAMTAAVMASSFVLIPNLSSHLLDDLGYPRDRLGLLYLVGGAASFFGMRVAGWFVDRFGSFRVGTFAFVLVALDTWTGFGMARPPLPIAALFVGFMLTTSLRNVAYNTLTSKVPRPPERARFMSLQSSVQHAASAAGAFVSARLLHALPSGALEGMPRVALASIAIGLLVPVFMRVVEQRVDPAHARGASAG